MNRRGLQLGKTHEWKPTVNTTSRWGSSLPCSQFSWKTSGSSPRSGINSRFPLVCFTELKSPSVHSLLRVFIVRGGWTLSGAFFCIYWYDHMIFLFILADAGITSLIFKFGTNPAYLKSVPLGQSHQCAQPPVCGLEGSRQTQWMLSTEDRAVLEAGGLGQSPCPFSTPPSWRILLVWYLQ